MAIYTNILANQYFKHLHTVYMLVTHLKKVGHLDLKELVNNIMTQDNSG